MICFEMDVSTMKWILLGSLMVSLIPCASSTFLMLLLWPIFNYFFENISDSFHSSVPSVSFLSLFCFVFGFHDLFVSFYRCIDIVWLWGPTLATNVCQLNWHENIFLFFQFTVQIQNADWTVVKIQHMNLQASKIEKKKQKTIYSLWYDKDLSNFAVFYFFLLCKRCP